MTAAPGQAPPDPWAEACLAAMLLAVDPAGLGGAVLRARPGPARDDWLAMIDALMPAGAPRRKLPAHMGEDRLLGGLDLAATAKAARPVWRAGLLAQVDGGLLTVAMAERLAPTMAAHIAAALDRGRLTVERDGFGHRVDTRFAAVLLDEGIEDEAPAPALMDRLAFHLFLDGLPARGRAMPEADRAAIAEAAARLDALTHDDAAVEALIAAASALGVASLRAPLMALKAARALAALAGASAVRPGDVATAARLVLGPRATRVPMDPPPEEDAPAEPPPPDPRSDDSDPPEGDSETGELGERVLDAARAAIPKGLLESLLAGERVRRASAGGKAGAVTVSNKRGRPIGARRGAGGPGARLNVVETLRAAAPWQTLRRRETGAEAGPARLAVTRDDFRFNRYKHRAETVTIFLVDASGSAAFNRLAEAKGAVELLLADCYVRRDSVALIAFSGRGVELALAPTRSLARAKRQLAGLPGGGGTPLAGALEQGMALADAVRRKGQTPVLVLLSDGRANIARDGAPGRARAEADALAAARGLRGLGVSALAIDIAPRPRPFGQTLAREMGARYLALPYADAQGLSRAVRAVLPGLDA